jgi:hypothetical protein
MKKEKKSVAQLPEVQIMGDLEDVSTLLKAISKKRGLVLFRDAEKNISHAEVEGSIQEISEDEIKVLQKDFRFIYFDFFPGKKKVAIVDAPVEEPVTAAAPEVKKAKVKKPAKEKGKKKSQKGKGK